LDEAAPSAPELQKARVSVVDSRRGCLRPASPCEGNATLHLTIVPAADDFSPPERITYAMYGGATSDEAAGAELPHRLLVARGDGSELGESWNLGDVDDVEWVALTAVDQAGNES